METWRWRGERLELLQVGEVVVRVAEVRQVVVRLALAPRGREGAVQLRVSSPLSRHRVQLGLAVGEVPAEPPEIVRLLLVEVVARLHGAALRELTALLLLDRRHLLLRPLQHAHVLRLTAARRAHLLEVHAQLVQRRLQPPHHVLVRHHRELLRRSRYALPLFFSCTVGDALHLRSGHGGPDSPRFTRCCSHFASSSLESRDASLASSCATSADRTS